MNKQHMQQALAACPLIAILRGIEPETVIAVGDALAEAGFRLIEITMNFPQATRSIELAAAHFAGTDIAIGAGTVLTPDEVDRVADTGGAYIISPDCNPAVIERTKERGLLAIPGIFTPTEAFTALRHGADFLKLFPAGRLAPDYIKDLKAVVPAEIIAVGGIGKANMKSYLSHAIGVGVGSSLYKAGRSADETGQRASAMIQALNADA